MGNEKKAKNGLEVQVKHQKGLYEAAVKNLEERIVELKSDKRQYMGKVSVLHSGVPHESLTNRKAPELIKIIVSTVKNTHQLTQEMTTQGHVQNVSSKPSSRSTFFLP